jgi:hypothetical protein
MMNKIWLLPLVLVVGCASKPQFVEIERPVEKSVPLTQSAVTLPVQTPVALSVEDAKIANYTGPVALNRSDVIGGSRDCINAKMKPTVEYLAQKTGKGVVMVPVNVHCDPFK